MIGGITGKPGAKIAVEHEHFRDGVRVLIWNEEFYYRCTFEQVPHDQTMTVPNDESFIRFTNAEAQALCQALSDAGFKPDDGSGNPAHVRALESNLNDVRQMVSIETGHVTRLLSSVGLPQLEQPRIEPEPKDDDITRTFNEGEDAPGGDDK